MLPTSWPRLGTARDKNYAELVAFKEAHGHCNLPKNKSFLAKLGSWCAIQRLSKARLTRERLARLEAIGFSWTLRDTLWDNRCAELAAYKQAHGDCNVPKESGYLGR